MGDAGGRHELLCQSTSSPLGLLDRQLASGTLIAIRVDASPSKTSLESHSGPDFPDVGKIFPLRLRNYWDRPSKSCGTSRYLCRGS
jgi:hypothetical protein